MTVDALKRHSSTASAALLQIAKLVPPSVTVEPRVRGSAGSMVGILPYTKPNRGVTRLFLRKLLVNSVQIEEKNLGSKYQLENY